MNSQLQAHAKTARSKALASSSKTGSQEDFEQLKKAHAALLNTNPHLQNVLNGLLKGL